MNRYALGGQPFWVKLYLAQEEGVQTPITDLIAEVYNFSQKPELDGAVVCGNCTDGQKAKVKSTAYIPITPVLFKLARSGRKLKSLSRDEVLEYIRKRAYWRVFKVSQCAYIQCQRPVLTPESTGKNCRGTMSKSSTSRSSVAATTPKSSRILRSHLHSKTSRKNQPSPVVRMVRLIRS